MLGCEYVGQAFVHTNAKAFVHTNAKAFVHTNAKLLCIGMTAVVTNASFCVQLLKHAFFCV